MRLSGKPLLKPQTSWCGLLKREPRPEKNARKGIEERYAQSGGDGEYQTMSRMGSSRARLAPGYHAGKATRQLIWREPSAFGWSAAACV